MNDRQLQSFIEAAKMKSFSKAANMAYISTSALVQQINGLEQSLGFKLFERGYHGVELTRAGQEFLVASEKIISIYDEACEIGRAYAKEDRRTIRIAYPTEQFPDIMFQGYQEFCKDNPEVDVSFQAVPLKKQIQEVGEGNIDLCIIAEPSKEWLRGLYFREVCEDTYSFCMRPGHPLASRDGIKMEDLSGYRVLCGNYSYLRQPFVKQLDQQKGIECVELTQEYDVDIRKRVLLTDELLVIHSLWAKAYESFLKVVSSDIRAGKVGVVYRDNATSIVKKYIEYMIQ